MAKTKARRLRARAALALLAAVAALGGCGGEEPAKRAATAVAASPFAYDRSRPLRLRDRGVVNRNYPIRIHDVSFASPLGGRVAAYLLVPRGGGRRPAVIYLHGSGGDRLQLVAPASWMAARGAVTLTVGSPASRSPQKRLPPGVTALRRARDLEVRTVVELRRAVDLLQSLPAVDARRIGFVGFSAGARTGATLAGVERRIRAFVLMSGGAEPLSRYAAAAPPHLRGAVARIFRDADPLRLVRRARPGVLFFQNGRRDALVPRRALRALARAAPAPKRVRWYDAGHTLNRRAYRDQLAWLAERLALRGPAVAGAVAGP